MIKQLKKSYLPAILWSITVTVLFLLPGSSLPDESWFELVWLDKWVHAGIFFILVYLFWMPGRQNNKLPLLVSTGIVYGITIEIMQRYLVTGRSFDVWDIVFDALGCLIAFVFIRLVSTSKK